MYGKVFDSIYDGTLAGHWEAIVTMQQLIVLSTPDGVVDMTPEAIAGRTTIPLKIIKKGLEHLAKPDPFTRTPGEDGRRIVLLDDHRPWGWRLVNHGKYMRLRNMEEKRKADRDRISEKRKKINSVATMSQSVANVAHSDSDSDLVKPLSGRSRDTDPDGFEILWKAYPRRAGNNPRSKALKAYRERVAEKHNPVEMIDGVGRYARFVRATGKEGTEYVQMAATFLGADKPFLQPWTSPSAVASSDARRCAYCGDEACGSVSNIWHCRSHVQNAMDGEPVRTH